MHCKTNTICAIGSTGKSKHSSRIPKKKPTFEPEQDEQDLGEERELKFKVKNKSVMEKYIDSRKLLADETAALCTNLEKLVLYSVTSSTWSKHSSAWNTLATFCKEFGIIETLPLSIENARAYTTWALSSKKLKHSTVESYLSSITFAHTLAGVNCEQFLKDRCIQTILKGANNIALLKKPSSTSRLAMNIHLLNLLGHKLASTNWCKISKQIVWTACSVSFYSSCRMGEILSEKKNSFDPKTTLKWEDVKFVTKNEIVIQLPYTKTTGLKGMSINLFPLRDSSCPVAALKQLHSMLKKENLLSLKSPVFKFRTGLYLTVPALNELLSKFFEEFNDDKHKITCHSFRAAMPSAIASQPHKFSTDEVKDWGKWHSDSYKRYARQDRDKDRVLFYKSVEML